MAGARTHKELICWQRAYEAKVLIYRLILTTTARRDFAFRKQLREAVSSAPRLMAEGFGRYYPAEFARFLRLAVGELKETIESLDDGVDRCHFKTDEFVAPQRLVKRSIRASSRLAVYLDSAEAPYGAPDPPGYGLRGRRRRGSAANPRRTH